MISVFLFGATGMLGRYVMQFLESRGFTVKPIRRSDYDITAASLHTIKAMFVDMGIAQGDVVINCAGIIPQSGVTSSIDTFAANAIFPVLLDDICDNRGCPFIQISTDCVFSGRGTGGYLETDTPNETSIYGVSKSLGDRHFGTTIRTSIVGEERGPTPRGSLLEHVRSQRGCAMRGYTNHRWNGITCLQLAKIIYQIIMRGSYWGGVRHIFSPRAVSKLELVSTINIVYQLGIDVEPYDAPECIDKTLSSIKLPVNEFGIPDIQDQLVEQRNFRYT
jgi:dTDP-4-dehydrorhamnose reductase